MNGQRKYLYTVQLEELENGLGGSLPPMQEIAMAFFATTEEAQRKFFDAGYALDSDVFDDNGLPHVSDKIPTTDGSNSYNDDVPNRVKIIMKDYPLLRVFPDATFGILHVQRFTSPVGGSRKHKSRKNRKSKSRKMQKQRRLI